MVVICLGASMNTRINITGVPTPFSAGWRNRMDRHSWCPKCREYIHANQVTFEETHDGCGMMVIEKDPEEELAPIRAERDAALSRAEEAERNLAQYKVEHADIVGRDW